MYTEFLFFTFSGTYITPHFIHCYFFYFILQTFLQKFLLFFHVLSINVFLLFESKWKLSKEKYLKFLMRRKSKSLQLSFLKLALLKILFFFNLSAPIVKFLTHSLHRYLCFPSLDFPFFTHQLEPHSGHLYLCVYFLGLLLPIIYYFIIS